MVTQILAVDEEWGIGKDNTIPWHNKEDFKHFKETTKGGFVVMGRKTWDSLPKKPLDCRINVVISSHEIDGPNICSSQIDGVIEYCNLHKQRNTFIIGGGTIYKQTLSYTDSILLSRIKGKYDCDTFYDQSNLDEFVLNSTKEFETFTLERYLRN